MSPLQAVIERAFAHIDQIRLGWHLLRDADEEVAMMHVRSTQGDADKYHETWTRAFMYLIQAGRSALPATHTFDEFCLMYPELLRDDALALYYSRDALFSSEARMGWINPDLRALPARAD